MGLAATRTLLAALVATGTMALGFAAAGLEADSDAARRTCRAPGSETVVQTGRGRVYRYVANRPGETVTRTYVCLYKRKRKVLLTRDVYPSDGGGVRSLHHRLTVPFVAFVRSEDTPTGDLVGETVFVVDGRNGRTRRQSGETGVEAGGLGVTDIEVTRTAAVAWINQGSGNVHQVRAFDADGERVLDNGPIELQSLTRSGNTVSWVKGGSTRSETLR